MLHMIAFDSLPILAQGFVSVAASKASLSFGGKAGQQGSVSLSRVEAALSRGVLIEPALN